MRIVLFALMALVASCRDSSSPAQVLSQDKMKLVVWDMLQADELAFQHKMSDSTLVLKQESFKLYDQVFAIHQVSRQQFYSSYKYYQEHPAKYKELMEAVAKYGEKKKTLPAPSKLKK